jgi:hypothetical protein
MISEGWNVVPQKRIQRVAPLASWPNISSAAIMKKQITNRMAHTRRAHISFRVEDATSTPADATANTTCR